jgi:23S rRNA pseudouridine1911/1915/1917 synthase
LSNTFLGNHQLRVHFNEAGFPIVGDSIYNKEDKETIFGLQAFFLGFEHPVSGERIQLKLPFPGEYESLLNKKST